MSITDHITLLRSKETPYETLFENQSWLYINDINTSYENSTSVIETSSLSNSGKYACYNKAYLSVPLLVTLTADNVEATGVKVAIKQSFLSLVNSLTVDLNGTNIIQQNNLIDVVNHFQVLTTESASTKPRWATIGFGETVAVRQSYLNLGAGQTVLSAVELAKLHQSNASKMKQE